MAGIRRADIIKKRKRTPYHKVIAGLVLFTLVVSPALHSQTTQHYEAILIDTSRSIARGRANKDLFQEYLHSARRLLATEPPNTRVWVSGIATDSFGGLREILKGFTPDAGGIFTDDLNGARRQLAISFETNSSTLSPSESGTDIFGALWHVKAIFDAGQEHKSSDQPSRNIWIFSYMMNETNEFPMPQLLELGPERMLGQSEKKQTHSASDSLQNSRRWSLTHGANATTMDEAQAVLGNVSRGCGCRAGLIFKRVRCLSFSRLDSEPWTM
jgi:hypothetical protein